METRIDSPEHDRTVGHGIEKEYLTSSETAARLRWAPRTLREKVRTGVFRRGVHFFEPPGCQRRWRWSAVAAWLEGERPPVATGERLRGWMQGGAALDVHADREHVHTTGRTGR